jgi:hypothetical protein
MPRATSKLYSIGAALAGYLELVDSSRDSMWLSTIGRHVFFGKTASWVAAPRPKVLLEWEGWDSEGEVQPRHEGTADFRITVETGDVGAPEQEMLDAFADVLRVVSLAGRLDDLVYQVWPVSGGGETEFFQRTGKGTAHLVVRVIYGYEADSP